MVAPSDFAIFILSHGRPDRVDTHSLLLQSGYTGPLYIVIDNEDKAAAQYYARFGDKVIMFDKAATAATFDEGDNFGDRRAVIYARNACFGIAEKIGITRFMELDDDYTEFRYKASADFTAISAAPIKNLDAVLNFLLQYYEAIPAKAIAMAQGGDFLGGRDRGIDKEPGRMRKCMNSFICSTKRPFQFVGRINEDVNTYTWYQSLGNLFLTFALTCIEQRRTQHNVGGMTEMYLDSGTYIKSFYTVMYQPSSVCVQALTSRHQRLHHRISWEHTVPCIIAESYRKKRAAV